MDGQQRAGHGVEAAPGEDKQIALIVVEQAGLDPVRTLGVLARVALELHIADLARDGQILQVARDMARLILTNDPNLETPENRILKEQLQKKAPTVDWGRIS